MRAKEIFEHVEKAGELFERYMVLKDALDALEADYRFVRISHDTYLPAAKAYRDYIKHGGSRKSAEFKRLRGKLGQASSVMYKTQKETFVKLVHLLTHRLKFGSIHLVPDVLIDRMWRRFQKNEEKWLTRARKA